MKNIRRKIVYAVCGGIFLVSMVLMLYYGKETFYVDNDTTPPHVYDYHFALITEEVGNEYWDLIETGAKEEAASHNIYLEYTGPKKADDDEKLQDLDRMISAKVDGIISQGISGERFVDLVHKATENGIPVVTVDTDVPKSERKAYTGTDNYYAGFIAGQTLVKDTKGKQYVGVVAGSFDALNQQARLQGFKDAIKSENRIELVDSKESNISEIGAVQATYSLLRQNPEITVLFGMSALDGVGMVQGVGEIDPSDYPYIISFDILPGTLELIEEGKIAATVVQYPKKMGETAVEMLLELQKKSVIQPLHYIETGIIKKEDISNGEIVSEADQP